MYYLLRIKLNRIKPKINGDKGTPALKELRTEKAFATKTAGYIFNPVMGKSIYDLKLCFFFNIYLHAIYTARWMKFR